MDGPCGAQGRNGEPSQNGNGHASDADRELAPIVFAFIERRSESIEKLCKYVLRNTRFPLDEAISECTIRVFDAARTYRADGGASFDTHALGTLRLYLTKLVHTRTPAREAWRKEQLLTQPNTEAIEQREQAQFVWQNLPEDDAALLELRFINECSLEEIAEIFECSTSKVCGMIQRALQVAKQIYDSGR
jgi:RNA polymerase sigma factor (sigma-70 family)